MLRIVTVLSIALAACSPATGIRPVQDVPADVRAAMDEAWLAIEENLAWATECAPPVELFLTRDVADGSARYRFDERVIDIEIPTSPRRFKESLVHEYAHHVDTTCVGLHELRDEFAAAQDLDPARWDDAEEWDVTPAEHFAEAVVAVVTGDRFTHGDRISLSPAAVDLVRHGP